MTDLADVQQPIEAAYIDEGTVSLHSLHNANYDVAHFVTGHLALGAGAAVAEHQALALFVYLQELHLQVCAHHVIRNLPLPHGTEVLSDMPTLSLNDMKDGIAAMATATGPG